METTSLTEGGKKSRSGGKYSKVQLTVLKGGEKDGGSQGERGKNSVLESFSGVGGLKKRTFHMSRLSLKAQEEWEGITKSG